LLEGCSALFERALGVVGHLGGDRLPALVPLAEHLHGGIHVVLAEFLEVIEVDVLDHWCGPVLAGCICGGMHAYVTVGATAPCAARIYAPHKKCQHFMLRRNMRHIVGSLPNW